MDGCLGSRCETRGRVGSGQRYSLLDNTHGNLDVNVLLLHIFS